MAAEHWTEYNWTAEELKAGFREGREDGFLTSRQKMDYFPSSSTEKASFRYYITYSNILRIEVTEVEDSYRKLISCTTTDDLTNNLMKYFDANREFCKINGIVGNSYDPGFELVTESVTDQSVYSAERFQASMKIANGFYLENTGKNLPNGLVDSIFSSVGFDVPVNIFRNQTNSNFVSQEPAAAAAHIPSMDSVAPILVSANAASSSSGSVGSGVASSWTEHNWTEEELAAGFREEADSFQRLSYYITPSNVLRIEVVEPGRSGWKIISCMTKDDLNGDLQRYYNTNEQFIIVNGNGTIGCNSNKGFALMSDSISQDSVYSPGRLEAFMKIANGFYLEKTGDDLPKGLVDRIFLSLGFDVPDDIFSRDQANSNVASKEPAAAAAASSSRPSLSIGLPKSHGEYDSPVNSPEQSFVEQHKFKFQFQHIKDTLVYLVDDFQIKAAQDLLSKLAGLEGQDPETKKASIDALHGEMEKKSELKKTAKKVSFGANQYK